ncbi:MAG: DUF1573 domain-containing protein [Saprospiraceae bacterium]|nr:DUF1573 domain-containing protein [Saprospiraceae bacterium]MCF8249185.1 DUF1573 domain-containing protein [Saprospiraceae bacterium]MCF8281829.1 DUF1573 domain-containing protein [Bacteroidales bacterium]MCF8311314.1 DUF1573 domain-containing protein [Saprospiraceae bacterium]MCF8440122.1 DUF1573 domain-containing protein [Saprospiraceae bacterium]
MLNFLFPLVFLFQTQIVTEPTFEWVTPTTHDFGDLELSVPAPHEFKFKNTGDAPLIIDNVRSICGCTATEWTETPVLPNEEGIIKVEFDARKAGYFYKKVTVYFNGQKKGEKLYVEGFVD